MSEDKSRSIVNLIINRFVLISKVSTPVSEQGTSVTVRHIAVE